MRAAVDCGETDRGEMREEIVGGNACGGKPGSHGSKAILLSHALGGGAITTASLSPYAASAAEKQSSWPIKSLATELKSRIPPRVHL